MAGSEYLFSDSDNSRSPAGYRPRPTGQGLSVIGLGLAHTDPRSEKRYSSACLLYWATKKLCASDSPALDSEVLLSFTLKRPKEFLFSHPEFEPTEKQISKFKKLIARRTKGEPIAYLIGRKEFYSLNFEVNKNVLVPRPETELMVEEAIKEIDGQKEVALIDIGAGSGCIPIAILKTAPQVNTKKIKCFAIDISAAAIAVARRNAQKHGIKIKFLRGDLLAPIIKNPARYLSGAKKIIITANLPYLTAKQYCENPALRFEPKFALVASKNGLVLYEKLLKQTSTCHSRESGNLAYRGILDSRFRGNDNHVTLTLFLEIDPSQSRAIKALIKKHLPRAEVEIKKDYVGRDRIIHIKTYPQMQN